MRPPGGHVVHHYQGDDAAPRLLKWIEDRIDEVSGSATWVVASIIIETTVLKGRKQTAHHFGGSP